MSINARADRRARGTLRFARVLGEGEDGWEGESGVLDTPWDVYLRRMTDDLAWKTVGVLQGERTFVFERQVGVVGGRVRGIRVWGNQG